MAGLLFFITRFFLNLIVRSYGSRLYYFDAVSGMLLDRIDIDNYVTLEMIITIAWQA